LTVEFSVDVELDATRLRCPMPLLKLKQQLNRMSVGQCIRVRATDKGSVRDFAAFLGQVGHRMLEQAEISDEFVFIIQKES